MPVSRWTRRRWRWSPAPSSSSSRCSPSPRSRSADPPTSWSTTAARSTATSRRSRPSSRETGLEVELRGGTAPELFERLAREGDATAADLLVTTDLANLWRAKDAGPARARRHARAARARRARAARPRRRVVGPQHPHPHADALDRARPRGRRHELRGPRRPALPRPRVPAHVSNNEYNQSFVADRIAKHGEAATEELLRSWMDNDAADPRLRRRRARRDRRRPLRRRADQPLLPRPRAEGEPGLPGRARVARPGRRRARTRTSPASGSSRAPSTARTRSG